MRQPGKNLLTEDIDFSDIIPTRAPRAGEPSQRVPLSVALEIADAFYLSFGVGGRNAEYCRCRRQRAAEEAPE